MAIINCKECGKEISDKARKCTHCGNPQKTAIKSILDVISNNKRKFKF
ncbi:MAG: zinc ribbon domain-containing protein [Ruminococcaceae bacterium]|nr:zinc ribbon domain-containing protein [Oscillospiraceae bacterium]